MKILCFFICLFMIISINSFAQTCQWAEKIAGASSEDFVRSVATDESNNLFVAGYFMSSTLTFNNGKTLTNSGVYDGYIAKYNSSGQCQWAEKIAGTSSDQVFSITTDANGNVYVTGYFLSLTLTFNNGKSISNVGNYEGFIAKYNSSGQCQWAEKISGSSADHTTEITSDASGNIYLGGYFNSTTLSFNNGITLGNSGSSDGFIAKYNSSGVCQWAVKQSGTSDDIASSLALDANGNIFIVGGSSSSTLTLNNGKSLTNSGDRDVYIAKYNSNGMCQWAEKISGSNYEHPSSIVIDESGNAYIGGYFLSSTLSFNNGKTLSNSGTYDGFITKYNSSGTCQWVEKIAGTASDLINSLTMDSNDNLFVSGIFESSPITFNNSKTLTNSGGYDNFLAKYNNSGVCQWVEKIGGTSVDYSYSLTTDTSNNLYIAGSFLSSTLTFNNGRTLSNIGNYDGYIAKYSSQTLSAPTLATPTNDATNQELSLTLDWNNVTDATNYDIQLSTVNTFASTLVDASTINSDKAVSGLSYSTTYYWRARAKNSGSTSDWSAVWSFTTKAVSTTNPLCQWAVSIAGTGSDKAYCTKYDAYGNVYVAGSFDSPILSFNNNILLMKSGNNDSFIAKFNSSGLCLWAEKMSGNGIAQSIAVDGYGNVYVAGYFSSSIITFNNDYLLINSGQTDGFITKYNSSGVCQWATKIAGSDYDTGSDIILDEENLYVTGYFWSSTITFNNNKSLTKSSNIDSYIAKYNTNGICQWAEKISGSNYIYSIGADENGNIYIAGEFNSTTTTFNNGKTLTKNSLYEVAYLAKYNSSGLCQWAEKIYGDNQQVAESIIIDVNDNIYIAGYFFSSTLNFNNGIALTLNGEVNAFLAKYNSSGICQWAEKIYGDKFDYAKSLSTDLSGNVYVFGEFFSPTINFNNGITLVHSGISYRDSYFSKYNSYGVCQWAEKIAGTGSEYAEIITLDAYSNIFLSGHYHSSITTFNNGKTISNSDVSVSDAYIAKYGGFTLIPPFLDKPKKDTTNQDLVLTLDWYAVTGATNYDIQLSTVNTFATTIVDANTTNTEISVSGLSQSTKYYWRAKAKNSNGTSDWSSIRSFTTMVIEPVPSSWDYTDFTGNNSTVIIPKSISPKIENRDFKLGDAVGFFFKRNDSLICAGYGAWNNVNLAVTVWGDNTETTLKDGLATNESYTIKIWDGQLGRELNTEVTYSSGNPFFVDDAVSVIGYLKGISSITQKIYLAQGWNMISSFLTPQNDSLEVICNAISNKLAILKNNSGLVYIPAYDINTIGKWNFENGYKAYLSLSDTLKITGMALQSEDNPIILNTGWNIVSYIRSSAKNISECLTTLTVTNSLTIAKNNAGQVYIPSYNINSIGDMLPGQGYQMYLSKKDTLVYPSNGAGRNLSNEITPMAKYILPEFTETGNSAVLLLEIEGTNGDEISVYNNNNQVIGSGVIHNNKAAITIWGDNERTSEIDGATINDELRIMNYELKTGRMNNVKIAGLVDFIYGDDYNNLTYSQDAFYFAKGIVENNSANFTMEVSPNPASDYIEITLDGESDNTSLVLYNNNGKQIADLTSELLTMSGNKMRFNTSDLSSGSYNLVLTNGANKIMKKLLIIK